MNAVHDVTINGTTQTIIAPSVGNACRIAFRNLARRDVSAVTFAFPKPGRRRNRIIREAEQTGKIFRTPSTDRDNKQGGLFKGVSVQVRHQGVFQMPKPISFADLTKAVCQRNGLPWIPPMRQRSK